MKFNIFTVLGVVLVILKVTGVIGLSWLWVLAPFWGPLLIGGVIVLAVLLFGLAAVLFGKKIDPAATLRVVGK